MFDGISLDCDSYSAPSALLWQSPRGCCATTERNGDGLFSWSYRVECLCNKRQLFRGRQHSGAAASAEAIYLGTSIRCSGVQAA